MSERSGSPAVSPTDEQVVAHLPLSARDFHVLFGLAEGERHGYGLVKSIADETGGLVQLDPANLYRALQAMVEAGLVEDAGRRPAPEASGRERRYYGITALGRRVVQAEARRMQALAATAEARRLIPRRRDA